MTAQPLGTAESETLRFGYGTTVLGTIAVAESPRGIAALFIGDDPAKLRRELKDAFPEAALVPDQAGLAWTIAKAAALVDAPHTQAELALDLCGSSVEVAVWQALRVIPPGETRTYGGIAQCLPMAATAREVGAACAANRIAVAVPCHRVVKSNGSLAGYRWGVQRKRRLIDMEGRAQWRSLPAKRRTAALTCPRQPGQPQARRRSRRVWLRWTGRRFMPTWTRRVGLSCRGL